MLCPFCNLNNETDNHVLWKCIKTKELWSLVASITRIILNHEESFPDGACLIKNWKIWMGNKVFKALLAACAWSIWKARCNLVFNKVQPRFSDIFQQAWRLIDHAIKGSHHMNREVSFCFLNVNTVKVFIDDTWICNASPSGLGFVIIVNDSRIILVGASPTASELSFPVELQRNQWIKTTYHLLS